MTAEYAQTDQFRGARIHLCDLAGLEIRDCEVSGLKIVDCYGSDVLPRRRLRASRRQRRRRDRLRRGRARPAAPAPGCWPVTPRPPTTTGPLGTPSRRCGRRRSTAPGCCPRPRCTSGSTANGRSSRRNDICCSPATPGSATPCSRSRRRTTRWAFRHGGMPADAGGEARAHPRRHPDPRRGAGAAARRMATMRARRRRAHRGRARSDLRPQAGRAVPRPGVRRPPLSQGGAEGRGRASPVCRARPRCARGGARTG